VEKTPDTEVVLTRKVGNSANFSCEINNWEERSGNPVIQWNRKGLEQPIYLKKNRLSAVISAEYRGRLTASKASIVIRRLTVEDEGWYRCSVLFDGEYDDSDWNRTWIELRVKGNREESMTNCEFDCA